MADRHLESSLIASFPHLAQCGELPPAGRQVSNTAEHNSLSEPDVSKEHSSSLEEFQVRSRDLKGAITKLDTL